MLEPFFFLAYLNVNTPTTDGEMEIVKEILVSFLVQKDVGFKKFFFFVVDVILILIVTATYVEDYLGHNHDFLIFRLKIYKLLFIQALIFKFARKHNLKFKLKKISKQNCSCMKPNKNQPLEPKTRLALLFNYEVFLVFCLHLKKIEIKFLNKIVF